MTTSCDLLIDDDSFVYDDHFSLRSRRSRGRRCRRDACCSSRLGRQGGTDVVEKGWEPHHPEAVAVQGAHQVAVHHPFLEASVHVVEVEVLVGV